MKDKKLKELTFPKYLALSTPVSTYNEYVPITDDGTDRRFKKNAMQ